jgi:hypothetical protein
MRELAFAPYGKGRRVTLTTDPTQDTFDRYRRLLAYAALAARVHRQVRARTPLVRCVLRSECGEAVRPLVARRVHDRVGGPNHHPFG